MPHRRHRRAVWFGAASVALLALAAASIWHVEEWVDGMNERRAPLPTRQVYADQEVLGRAVVAILSDAPQVRAVLLHDPEDVSGPSQPTTSSNGPPSSRSPTPPGSSNSFAGSKAIVSSRQMQREIAR